MFRWICARMENSLPLLAKMARALCLPAILALGTGCANQVHLSRSDYASLHSVTVSKQAAPVESVYYMPIGQNLAFAFGGVAGLAVAQAAGASDKDQLAQQLATPETNPARIVGEVFESHIRTSGLFSVVASHGDANFVFHVRSAGIGIPHGFTGRMEVALFVKAQLVKNDGRVLWEQEEKVIPADNAGGKHGNADLLHNPAALRSAFEGAAELLVKDWTEDIQQDLGKVRH
jgi:hypothetical protein